MRRAIPHNPDPDPTATPVVVRVANFASVSTGRRRSTDCYLTALTKRGPFGVPDVVLGCEASDFDAVRLAAAREWGAVQFGRPGDAESGSVIAWRDAEQIGKPQRIVGSTAGEGIRERSVVQVRLEVNGHVQVFNAGHAPPDRAPTRQKQWLDNAADLPGVIGADFNTWPKQLDVRFDRQVRGVEVLSLLIPHNIPCTRAEPVEIGSDHPAVDVRLWIQPKENR